MDRRQISELARNKIGKQRVDKVSTDRTGGQALQILLAEKDEISKPKEEFKEEPKKQVILYLRDGLKGATANWTKYPNEIHDLIAHRLDIAESVLYLRLWRESWGHNKNYCRYSHTKTLQSTSIKSIGTARRAMMGLVEKRFIIRASRQENGKHDIDKEGALYRILTPKEISEVITDEGVRLEDIPIEGVFCVIMITQNIDKNPSKNNGPNNMIDEIMIHKNNDLSDHDHTDHSDMINRIMINRINPDEKQGITSNEPTMINEGMISKITLLKDNKDNLKDSLSPARIVSSFYESIGQTKITKEKSARAEKDFEELRKDGFSLQDIQFAVEWTLKNPKKDFYDFSIIKHTIGEAVAAREKVEAKEARRLEQEQIALEKQAEEEIQEKEKAKLENYKESLNTDERAELRERALKEIRNLGDVKEEFINNILINFKENEILKRELAEPTSEPRKAN